jgi:hypothetical protein
MKNVKMKNVTIKPAAMQTSTTNSDTLRIIMARQAAAHLAATIVLNRARHRAATCADARAFATMPQTDWLTAMENDLVRWLHQGGFAGCNDLPPGLAPATKTAA